ncbi:MAG: hypothetical protein ABII18_03505 [bacterium]|nr:hypothetical protein [bacterium]MBU1918189.1 hypothetical protein [bacterium]
MLNSTTQIEPQSHFTPPDVLSRFHNIIEYNPNSFEKIAYNPETFEKILILHQKVTGSFWQKSPYFFDETTDLRAPSSYPYLHEYFLGSITTRDFIKLSEPLNQDLELFELQEIPGTLVIDFRNTQRQSVYMDRISHFIEVKRGEIYPQWEFEDELKRRDRFCDDFNGDIGCGLGGGHDLTAKHLADFFNAYQANDVSLTFEETELRDILVLNNILTEDHEGFWIPADNAVIITTCRSFSPDIRLLTTQHEVQHAAFFLNPDYAQAVSDVWHSFTEREQKILASLLYYTATHYDIHDDTLLLNEVASNSIEPQYEFLGWHKMFITSKEHFHEVEPTERVLTHDEFLAIDEKELALLAFRSHQFFKSVALKFNAPILI